MNLMLRLSLFETSLLVSPKGAQISKGIKCFTLTSTSTSLVRNNTHGGFLTHLALFLTSSGTSFPQISLHFLPLSEVSEVTLLHSALVQVPLTRRLVVREPIIETQKNPRASKRQSRDPSTNLRLLAWVCCPLIGSSLRLDV